MSLSFWSFALRLHHVESFESYILVVAESTSWNLVGWPPGPWPSWFLTRRLRSFSVFGWLLVAFPYSTFCIFYPCYIHFRTVTVDLFVPIMALFKQHWRRDGAQVVMPLTGVLLAARLHRRGSTVPPWARQPPAVTVALCWDNSLGGLASSLNMFQSCFGMGQFTQSLANLLRWMVDPNVFFFDSSLHELLQANKRQL